MQEIVVVVRSEVQVIIVVGLGVFHVFCHVEEMSGGKVFTAV